MKLWLQKYCKRFVLRSVWRAQDDRYNKLNTFYLMKDPWHMTSPNEQYRFAETNRFILEKFGRVKSLSPSPLSRQKTCWFKVHSTCLHG